MRIIRNRRIVSLLLAFVLCCSLMTIVFPTTANAVTDAEIAALQAQRAEIIAQREEQQAVVDELKEQQAGIQEQIDALNLRNEYALEQLALVEQEMDIYRQIIAEKQEEVDAAQKLEDDQLTRYRTRVRAMEENNGYNVLSLILSADSFAELLADIDDIEEIMESDKHLEDDYIAAREAHEVVLAEYQSLQAELESTQAELEAEQSEILQTLVSTQEELEELESQLQENSVELNALLEQERNITATIATKKRQLEAQKAAAAAAAAPTVTAAPANSGGNSGGSSGGGSSGGSSSGGTSGGSSSGGSTTTTTTTQQASGTGSFAWPANSTLITSRVGYRWHPVTGQWKYHSGLDIGASAGSAVKASDSGVVSLSKYYGGYGECVMIDHRNGYVTLYAHMSSRAVSVGQNVSKGQVVGYVGSTGTATGPHLHFEIRSGSTILDPENWFSGLSYTADAGD